MPGPKENPTINGQDKVKFEERIKKAQKALSESQQLADRARLAIELEQIQDDVKKMNKVIGKADKINSKYIKDGNGFADDLFDRKNRIEKKIDQSLDMQDDIDGRLSTLEERLGLRTKVDFVPSDETAALADKYSEPYEKNGKMYVKDKASGKEMLWNDVIAKENSLAGAQNVIPGGGVLGNLNSGLQNQVGYKEGNANNITQMAKYAAVAGLVYLRWTKTSGFAEKAGYAALAYALVSPCGFDLWNIIMNGKSNALNGGGLLGMANNTNNGSNSVAEVNANKEKLEEQKKKIEDNKKAIADYNNASKEFDKNKALGMASYNIFKDQATADKYIDKATGTMKYKELYEDYITNKDNLKDHLNTDLGGFDPKLSTTENFMGVLKGLLYDADAKPKVDDDLKKSEEDLNRQRSEHLKTIGADENESVLDKIKGKLNNKLKELKDMKEKAIVAALNNRGYKIVVGKEKEAFTRVDQLGESNPKLIETLQKEGLIIVDESSIAKEMNILGGSVAIPNLDQIEYDGVYGAEAVALAKKSVEIEIGEGFDIYNDNGKLYIQTGTTRTELVISSGNVIRLGAPFNNNIRGNLIKAMHIGLAVCHLKEYMGLLAQTKGKDKSGKDIIIGDFFDLSITATSISGIILNKKGIDAGRFGSLEDTHVSKATDLLKGYTEEVQDRSIVAGMNQLYGEVKNVWAAGKETPAEHLSSAIKYNPGGLPEIHNAENGGGDIKINLETEGSLRSQIKDAFDLIGGTGKDLIGGLYDGATGGLNTIQKDFRRRLGTQGKDRYNLGVDGIDRLSTDIRKGRDHFTEQLGNNMEYAIKWFLKDIVGGTLQLSYDQVLALVQKNKLLASLIGGLAGYGAAGLLTAGTAMSSGIGMMIAAAIYLLMPNAK